MPDGTISMHRCIMEWVRDNPFLFSGYEARSYHDKHGAHCDFNKLDTGDMVMRMTFASDDKKLSNNETHIWMSTASNAKYYLVGIMRYVDGYIEISIFKQRSLQPTGVQHNVSRISVDNLKLSIADPEFFNNLKDVILSILKSAEAYLRYQ